MNDVDWIAQVKKYTLQFGHYNFTVSERQRIAKYVRGFTLTWIHQRRFARRCEVDTLMVMDLMDEMEQGMIAAVTGVLTQ